MGATIAELRALPGASSDFVIAALEKQLPLADAARDLCAELSAQVAALRVQFTADLAAKDAAIATLKEEREAAAVEHAKQIEAAKRSAGTEPLAVGGDATKALASLDKDSPAAGWDQSAELRAHWEPSGGKRAFLNFARMQIEAGEDWRFLPTLSRKKA
jgi:hypothetical protein